MPQSSEHSSGRHRSGSRSGFRKLRRLFSRRKLKKLAPIIAAAVILLVFLYAVRFWEAKMDSERRPDTAGTVIMPEAIEEAKKEEELVFFDGGWYTPKPGLETTLILGVDKNADFVAGEGSKYEQADFLLLVVADTNQRSYTSIAINRDTMTDVMMLTSNGAPIQSFTGQIALAHAYGAQPQIGCRNTVRSVSALLHGIEIDHYMSLSMDGVAALNDIVGGVPVVVMDDFSGIDDTLVQGETVLLQGSHALTYIRARKGLAQATNIHRMERQQQYMESLQTQFFSCADADGSFIMNTVFALSDYLVSDCTAEQLSRIINNLHDYRSGEVYIPEGEVVYNDYAEFYPDEQALRQLVMDVFYQKADRT